MRARVNTEPAVSTLVLGLGGAGVRVLRQLKALKACCELEPKLLGCFGIDTEPGVQMRPLAGLPELKDEELLVLDGLEVRRLLSQLSARGEGRSLWPEVEAWLPDPAGLRLIDDLAPMGDALLRPLGRLVFWRFEDLVRSHITRALQAVEVERGPARLEGVRRVAVVASAGGGTGSGLLGDVVDLLRGYEDIIELLIFLIAPAVTLRAGDEKRADDRVPRRRRAAANAYACLKEVYHLKAGSLRWHGAERRQRRRRSSWCERVYLSDDATGAAVAQALAFNLHRKGQARAARMADRAVDAVIGAGPQADRRWSVFSVVAAARIDLAQYPPPADDDAGAAAQPPTPGPTAPQAAATAVPSTSWDAARAELDSKVARALRSGVDQASFPPARAVNTEILAFFDEVFGHTEPASAGWPLLPVFKDAHHAAAQLHSSRPEDVRRYLSERLATPASDASLADLQGRWSQAWRAREPHKADSWRERLWGVTRGSAGRQAEKGGWALVKLSLEDGVLQAALVRRVSDLLLRRAAGRLPSPEPVAAPEPSSPPPTAPVKQDLPVPLAQVIEHHVLSCRPTLLQASGPRRERLSYCLALVPRGRQKDVVAILRDRVPEILDCEVEIEETEDQANVVWLLHEDLFHEPKDVAALNDWYQAFTDESQPALLHVDRRFLADPEFTHLVGDDGMHKAHCGNPGCKHDIQRVARRPGTCPDCRRWIRSRCGNAGCVLEGLQHHAQGRARTCPGCGGLNHAAWWPCPRHGKIEHLVPIDKPRCPACVERHQADPLVFPEGCIGRRSDVGRYRECPGCVARARHDALHEAFIIGPDLWPYVRNGVNGHDHERFAELARHYRLADDYRCPRCRCYLIPVHHARLARSAPVEDCRDEHTAPEAFPIATATPLPATNGAVVLESAPPTAPIDASPAP